MFNILDLCVTHINNKYNFLFIWKMWCLQWESMLLLYPAFGIICVYPKNHNSLNYGFSNK